MAWRPLAYGHGGSARPQLLGAQPHLDLTGCVMARMGKGRRRVSSDRNHRRQVLPRPNLPAGVLYPRTLGFRDRMRPNYGTQPKQGRSRSQGPYWAPAHEKVSRLSLSFCACSFERLQSKVGEVVMNNTVFYRGILYALRTHRDEEEFLADGTRFHMAFRRVLTDAAAMDFGPAKEMLENFDPVFGVIPEANEMLLEAERDFILSMLNPHLQRAQFKISKERAEKELSDLPCPDVFRKLAATLDAQLRAQ